MKTSTAPRIAPVTPGTRPELRPLEERILRERGRISLLYQVLLNSPSLAEGWEAMLTAVRNRSSVPPRLRELVILRIATLNRAPYEFDAHVPHALEAGLSPAQVDDLRQDVPPAASAFDPLDLAVVRLTDAMTREIQVPDAVFEELRPHFDERALIELVGTVAAYNMVSRFLSALRIGG
jgi:alkylhydroperoxidase family enzyme